MARVAPFRGLRYDAEAAGDWGALLGPPYDIVDAARTATLRSASPYQIAHIETASGETEIAKAARRLADWREQGIIVQDGQPSFYLHEHRFLAGGRARTRRAIFGAVELSDWGEAGVMGHERTMPGPRATRTALRSLVGADVSPLLAFVPDRQGVLADLIAAARLQPPTNAGVDPGGDEHTLRVMYDAADVAAIESAFGSQRVYMGDGHHRYESALASRDDRAASGSVLMGIVCAGDPALAVGATHRVVHAPAPPRLRERLAAAFVVREVAAGALQAALPDGSATFALVTADGVYTLEPTEGARAAIPASAPSTWRALAPALLQEAVLEPIFGIDARALAGGDAVSYTHDPREALDAVRRGSAQAAFILPAPTLQDVIDTADGGGFMPQKSTYFVPKLPTGMVLHAFD